MTPTILVIVGITGDLATRKLLPAILALAQAGQLPQDFKVVGTTRQSNITLEGVYKGASVAPFIREHLHFFQMDVVDAASYQRLAEHLMSIEKEFGTPAQRLFYLSVPPGASAAIIEKLGTSGLANAPQTKLLLEKPFGSDYASASNLIKHLETHFTPEQVYRIDHYLAKDIAQSLLLRPPESNQGIACIAIRALEAVGIEGRADFYEQTGALRDLVQSHLLQLAALVALSPDETKTMPERRLDALRQFSIPSDAPIESYVRRGQYEGYRAEVANPKSVVETYVSLTLHSSDPRFTAIPITLTTGKKLGEKITDVHFLYKKSPAAVLTAGGDTVSTGYAKVFLDAMHSDHSIFVSSAEVLECWRIITPIQEAWGKSSADLFIYPAGSDPSTH